MAFNFFGRQDINSGVEEFKSTSNAVLLDVRSKDEYLSGHIPNSRHVDTQDIPRALSTINDKSTPLFVYCLSGARSNMAVHTLKQMGYSNVKNIGGIGSYKGTVERGV